MEMAKGDMLLAREMKTHSAVGRKSEPFSEAITGVALNCQKERLKKR
jgi:hypothetical protein